MSRQIAKAVACQLGTMSAAVILLLTFVEIGNYLSMVRQARRG